MNKRNRLSDWLTSKLYSYGLGPILNELNLGGHGRTRFQLCYLFGLVCLLGKTQINRLVGIRELRFGTAEILPFWVVSFFSVPSKRRPADTIRRVSFLCEEHDRDAAIHVASILQAEGIDCTVTISSVSENTESKYVNDLFVVTIRRNAFFSNSRLEPSIINQLINMKASLYVCLSRPLSICSRIAAISRNANSWHLSNSKNIIDLISIFRELASADTKIGAIRDARRKILRQWENRLWPFQGEIGYQKLFIRARGVLSCPVCRSSLKESKSANYLECMNCKRVYPYSETDFDFIPHENVLTDWNIVWRAWFESQVQALAHYQTHPEWNVSHKNRPDVAAFRSFISAKQSDRVIDIGCGSSSGEVIDLHEEGLTIGIDPYLSHDKNPSFFKIRAIAEALPIQDGSVDKAVFSTSLDHVISPLKAFQECHRVLKPDGRLFIWDTLKTNNCSYTKEEYLSEFRVSSSFTSIVRVILDAIQTIAPRLGYLCFSSTIWLKYGFPTPPPRIDSAHLYRINDTVLKTIAAKAGFELVREQLAPIEVSRPFKSAYSEFRKRRTTEKLG